MMEKTFGTSGDRQWCEKGAAAERAYLANNRVARHAMRQKGLDDKTVLASRDVHFVVVWDGVG